MTPHEIVIQDLVYDYPDGTRALRGVSFRVEPGEAVAVVGGNGAGKSTLLLQLIGSLGATSGQVRIGDRLLRPGLATGAMQEVGMVFQDADDQLFMPTVADDVAFGPLNAGFSETEVASRVASALAQVGMAHLAERPPYRLSAGEKRSVAIATALALSPGILVMDEPSSNLDPQARRRLIELLQSFEHTRIIATHDLELVVEICPRVVVLDHGKMVADGDTRQVLNDEALMLAHGLERPHILRHKHPH